MSPVQGPASVRVQVPEPARVLERARVPGRVRERVLVPGGDGVPALAGRGPVPVLRDGVLRLARNRLRPLPRPR